MSCKRTDLGGGAVSWSCSRGQRQPAELCEACHIHPATEPCGFPLRGAKAGQTCGKRMCRRCATPRDGVFLCPPHRGGAVPRKPET